MDNQKTQIINNMDKDIKDSTTVVNDAKEVTQVNTRSNDSTTVVGQNIGATEVVNGSGETMLNQVLSDMETATNNETLKASTEEIINTGDVIGEGYKITALIYDKSGEATIYTCVKDDVEYAAKIYKNNYQVDMEKMQNIYKLNSPYLVNAIATGTFKNRTFEILPFYKNGTLQDKMTTLSDDFIKNVVVDELNKALHLLHENYIIHNDVKPSNIFLSDDMKHIVLGDFGISKETNGRQYVTNIGNLTQIYAAPEADETSSPKTDYFSFGMTLLHVAFRGDPFEGFTARKVRQLILNEIFYIPEKIDQQLRGLITMLIKFAPSNRIGYDEVVQWQNNKNMYNDFIMDASTAKKFEMYKLNKPYKFGKTNYENVVDLTEAMIKDWSLALDHLDNGFAESIYADSIDDIVQIKNFKKGHTEDESLYFVLKKLNPTLKFTYCGYQFNDFEGYMNKIKTEYSANSSMIVSKGVLVEELKFEKYDERLITQIEEIFDDVENYPSNKVDLLLTILDEEGKIYYMGKIYKNLEELANNLFKGMDVVPFALFNNKTFQKYLITNYSMDTNLFNVDSNPSFGLNGNFAMKVLGYIPLKYKNKEFRTIDDFILYSKELYENNLDISIIGKWVKDGIIEKFCNHYKDITDEEKNIIRRVSSFNETQKVLGECFYFFTNKNSKYRITDSSYLPSISKLIEVAAKLKDLSYLAQQLVHNKSFEYWIMAKGGKVDYTNNKELL